MNRYEVVWEEAFAFLQESSIGSKEQQEVEGVVGEVENAEKAKEHSSDGILVETAIPYGGSKRVWQRGNYEHNCQADDRGR